MRLKHTAGQNLNSSPSASKNIPHVPLPRVSYGKGGDWLYDMLVRRSAMTPPAPPPAAVSNHSAMINAPDKMGAISRLYGRGRAAMGAFS